VHFIRGNLAVLERRLGQPGGDVPEIFADLHESCSRLQSVTGELLALGRKDSEIRGPVALATVAEFAIRMLRPQLGPGARIQNALAGDERVIANPQDVFQILLNLLQNAVHAVDPQRGEIVVDAVREAEAVEVRVRDNGRGILPEHMPRVFEPFFTTKPPGKGTGLGLSIVQKLVSAHEGSIALHSQPGTGTVASLRLPRGVVAAV
jgi:two-component system, NtrC family, sensor kinase